MVQSITSYISRSGRAFKTIREAENDEIDYLTTKVDTATATLNGAGLDPDIIWENRNVVSNYIDDRTAYNYALGIKHDTPRITKE